MTVHCIYHGGCPDGWTSAWLVKQAYPDAILHAGRYGEDPPEIPPGERIYMVDFSYSRDVILKMAETNPIVILDHHKTAQEALVSLPTNVFAVFNMNKSGARLTYEHFEIDNASEPLVNYVQDRDLWTWELPDTTELGALILATPYELDAWTNLARLIRFERDTAVSMGSAIAMRDKKVVEEIVSNAMPITIEGHQVLIAASPYAYGSTVAGELAEGYPFGAYYVDGPDGRSYGLRSRDDGEDVSEIAKVFGGGGHRNAAGFRMTWAEVEDYWVTQDDKRS